MFKSLRWESSSNQSQVIYWLLNRSVHKSYEFNCVLDANQNQLQCYNRCDVNSLIDAAIDGYSATVFAYGQTGSGKTYTMAGK